MTLTPDTNGVKIAKRTKLSTRIMNVATPRFWLRNSSTHAWAAEVFSTTI